MPRPPYVLAPIPLFCLSNCIPLTSNQLSPPVFFTILCSKGVPISWVVWSGRSRWKGSATYFCVMSYPKGKCFTNPNLLQESITNLPPDNHWLSTSFSEQVTFFAKGDILITNNRLGSIVCNLGSLHVWYPGVYTCNLEDGARVGYGTPKGFCDGSLIT